MHKILRKRKRAVFIILFLLIGTANIFVLGQIRENRIIARKDSVISIYASGVDPRIHVNGNWSETATAYDWCTGSGMYGDPYIIQDLIIDAEGSEYGILIENTDDYFMVENCTVFNLGNAGIKLYYVENGAVINSTVYNTEPYWEEGCGISLVYSSNITILHNNCTGNSRGIYLYCSNSNTIAENKCPEHYFNSILLDSSHNNTLSKNKCTQNNFGSGIDLDYSHNNTITENDCSNNDGSGISLYRSDSNTVSKNNCSDNGNDGLYLDYSNENKISGNNCTGNDCGIVIDNSYSSPSNNNTVIKNRCTGNSEYGIFVYSSDHNIITSNNCTDNEYGIFVWSSADNNTIAENDCSYNDYGIYISSSSYNAVTVNNCTDNEYGIYLLSSYFYPSNNNSVIKNRCTDNEYGIYIEANSHTIEGNNCTDNYYGIYLDINSQEDIITDNNCPDNHYGIYLDDSDDNLVTGNDCSFNNGSGICIYAADSNTVSWNNCTRNGDYGIHLDSYSPNDNEICNNLLVKNDGGCIRDEGYDNNIYNNTCILVLEASFRIDTTEIVVGKEIQFMDETNSGRYPLSYRWSFGDESSNSNVQNPLHEYSVEGVYSVILTVTDADEDVSTCAHVVNVTQDIIEPVLSSPKDVTYKEGTTGHSLNWTATDSSPDAYIVYSNSSEIESGTWVSNESIVVIIDGLSAGSYNYTLVVTDEYGNRAQDTVWVIVEADGEDEDEDNGDDGDDEDKEGPTPEDTSISWDTLGILLFTLLGIVGIVAVALRKRS